MERKPRPELIPIEKISTGCPYGFRFDYSDPRLETSLDQKGILFPLLLVLTDEKATIVSGHKRFFYALQKQWKQVPACFIEERFSEKEFFLLSLYANWHQDFSDLDRMEALRKGEEVFGFSAEEVREEMLPALGMPPDRSLAEEYRKVASLAGEVHSLIQQEKLPFRGASALQQFSREEQIFLARSVFDRVRLTTNQLRRMTEWFTDLRKITHSSLEAIFQERTFQEILEHPRLNPKARGRRLFETMRSLRFPRLSKEEEKLRRLKQRFGDAREIHVEWAEGFEGEGVWLRARLKDREGLARVLQFLENHRSSLESLL